MSGGGRIMDVGFYMRAQRLISSLAVAMLGGWSFLPAASALSPGGQADGALHTQGPVVQWAANAFRAGCRNRNEPEMHSGHIIIGRGSSEQVEQAAPAVAALEPGELLVREVSLISPCGPMAAPEGVVYSTSPQSALDLDGNRYVTKGAGDAAMVVAELIGYKFAELLKIPVPGFGVGRFGAKGEALFVSELVGEAQRYVAPW